MGAHGVNAYREMKNRAIVIAVTVAVPATVAVPRRGTLTGLVAGHSTSRCRNPPVMTDIAPDGSGRLGARTRTSPIDSLRLENAGVFFLLPADTACWIPQASLLSHGPETATRHFSVYRVIDRVAGNFLLITR